MSTDSGTWDRTSYHNPVLVDAVLTYLDPRPGDVIVDCTVGGGGHARNILERIGGNGILVGMDWDTRAIAHARPILSRYPSTVELIHDNFSTLSRHLDRLGIRKVNGVLVDCGVSSFQIQTNEYGIGFGIDGPLDMRMDNRRTFSAKDIIVTYSARALAEVIQNYGEERRSRAIANAIYRNRARIHSTQTLVDVIKSAVRGCDPMPSVRRVFQALRIAVNSELDNLRLLLVVVPRILQSGARLVVISFHSLEDRLVKQWMKQEASQCVCPPDLPICQCARQPSIRILTKRVVTPTYREVALNSRSASAKLRACERL